MALTLAQIQNLAIEWGVPDSPTIIADLIKRSGILQTAIVRKASHGIKHKYKIFNELPSATFRNIGGGIVPVAISKTRASIDLWNAVMLLEADYKDVEENPGSKAGWETANSPAAVEGFGQTIAKQIIYGTDPTFGSTNGFLGFHQYAKANSKVVKQMGGDVTPGAGKCSTLFAVRWDENDGASIRVGSQSNIVNIRDLTPATPVTSVTNTTTNEKDLVYQWLIDGFLSLIIPSATSVAAITQIDLTHAPTVTDINNLVDAVDTGTGQVYLYCNNVVRNLIYNLKDGKLKLVPGDTEYNTQVLNWNGMAPLVLDQNLSRVETSVLD